jgi:hypothetical protein
MLERVIFFVRNESTLLKALQGVHEWSFIFIDEETVPFGLIAVCRRPGIL